MKKIIIGAILPYITMLVTYLIAVVLEIQDSSIKPLHFIQIYLILVLASVITSVILFFPNRNVILQSKKISLLLGILFSIGVFISMIVYIGAMSLVTNTIPLGI